jgi:hypothetical protein
MTVGTVSGFLFLGTPHAAMTRLWSLEQKFESGVVGRDIG